MSDVIMLFYISLPRGQRLIRFVLRYMTKYFYLK